MEVGRVKDPTRPRMVAAKFSVPFAHRTSKLRP